jgi:hypothetical protein
MHLKNLFSCYSNVWRKKYLSIGGKGEELSIVFSSSSFFSYSLKTKRGWAIAFFLLLSRYLFKLIWWCDYSGGGKRPNNTTYLYYRPHFSIVIEHIHLYWLLRWTDIKKEEKKRRSENRDCFVRVCVCVYIYIVINSFYYVLSIVVIATKWKVLLMN